MRLAVALLALLLLFATSAGAQAPGAFAREHYRTTLRGVCPDPLIIQKDWLAQAEHGGLHQLIGAGGAARQGRHEGPLGATGIRLIILEGGARLGLGDGETAYSALYMGNSRARLRPHLAAHDLDNAVIFSKRFPAVGVVAMLERSPSVIFWDRQTYPRGFRSIEDLQAFAEADRGKIYVSTTRRTFVRDLIAQGVPKSVFVEGYRGDGELFVLNNGRWLNQGMLTNEVYKFAHAIWKRPIDHLLISDLGYDIYPSMISVAANRVEELAPCLEKLVPLLQRAQIDYVRDPAEVNAFLAHFNAQGYGASWWRTAPDLLAYSVRVQRREGIVGNGPNAVLGDFDMARVERLIDRLRPNLDIRAKPGVRAADIVTNRFIDPTIGLAPP